MIYFILNSLCLFCFAGEHGCERDRYSCNSKVYTCPSKGCFPRVQSPMQAVYEATA